MNDGDDEAEQLQMQLGFMASENKRLEAALRKERDDAEEMMRVVTAGALGMGALASAVGAVFAVFDHHRATTAVLLGVLALALYFGLRRFALGRWW
jgi:hypothetical protein